MAKTRAKAERPDEAAILSQVLSDAPPSADSAGLLRDIIREWGGTAMLARSLRTEFDAAAPGGQTRQRILETIQRLVIMNTQHDLSRSVQPSSMTDDDLARVAERLIKKVYDASAASRAV